MIERVRDFFGIEGVRLSIVVHGEPRLNDGIIAGKLLLETLRASEVSALSVVLSERYTRGRGADKLIDTYEVGSLNRATSLSIGAGEQLMVPFDLHFEPRLSPIDRAVAGKPLGRWMARAARLTVGASSQYELVATAEVSGTGVAPTTRHALELT